MLVHRYENIDDELVFGIFKKRLEDFDLFMMLIMDWAGRSYFFFGNDKNRAALGCGAPWMALGIGIVSCGLADLLPHAVLKQMQIYLRPDKFSRFSQIHTATVYMSASMFQPTLA